MADSIQHFLLIGSKSYLNRGCEAIVRGTVAILRREFGPDIRVTQAIYDVPEILATQAAQEADLAITYVGQPLNMRRWSAQWWMAWISRCLGAQLPVPYGALRQPLRTALAALEIGGDNYSLDYGLPWRWIEMDRYIQRQGTPVVLWGASVGPFDLAPSFAPIMFSHLRSLAGITVREPISFRYLRHHGISDNVYPVGDPAFAMESEQPERAKIGFAVPDGALGLNFSPLMAKYVTGGNMAEWLARCVEIVIALSRSTRRAIVLVPHETSSSILEVDDYRLLQKVADRAVGKGASEILCIRDNLSAAETKWVIAQCAAFAGARMHAVIAAMSSGIPTLSFAYSVKARGLHEEVFGSLDYCLEPRLLEAAVVTERFEVMLANAQQIRAHLGRRTSEITAAAFAGGRILRHIIESDATSGRPGAA